MSNVESDVHHEALLPGRDRPLDYVPRQGDPNFVDHVLFESLLEIQPRLWRAALPFLTLRESAMLQWMNTLTDEQDWNIMINNIETTSKWKEKALASGKDITSSMADWCIAELSHKASLIPPELALAPPPTVVYNGDVVKSDHALSADFMDAFHLAVLDFEGRIPERRQDWLPGSDGRVLNLVDPSLFPLVYGRTRVLGRGVKCTTMEDCVERCGEGLVLEDPQFALEEGHLVVYSKRFQWLPCEVDISDEEPRIMSYINNLHPVREKALYALIEKIIKASIPLWDLSLAPLGRNSLHFNRDLRIGYLEAVHAAKVPRVTEDEGENSTEDEGADEGEDADQNQDEDDENANESDDEFGPIDGPVILPEPELPFQPLPSPHKLSIKEAFGVTTGAHGRLQVVIKMQNIELTPDKPTYDCDSRWSGEDRMNDRIAATSIYVYSSHNITTPNLSFKHFFDPKDAEEGVSYHPGDSSWLLPVFGHDYSTSFPSNEDYDDDGCLTVQYTGTIELRPGRLVSFPSNLLHRMEKMKLVDGTKRGRCKFVVVYLVDPNVKVVSTGCVPVQRKDWWWDSVLDGSSSAATSGGVGGGGGTNSASTSPNPLHNLPVELQDRILNHPDIDFPLTMREALALRDEMAEERRVLDRKFREFLEMEGWSIGLVGE